MAPDARMSDLIAANPNVEQQMRDWQTERHQRGESPFDWQAFRVLEGYIGATDPGDVPPAEFYWFTPQATVRMRAPVAAASPSSAPSATLVSPATLRASAPGASAPRESSDTLPVRPDRVYHP